MVTKATVSYINKDNTQNCVTGNIMKSSEDLLIIHLNNKENSALRFDKNDMYGSLLESSSSDIKGIEIIDYSLWAFSSEIHFLLPNKSVCNEDEIIVSGIYNSKKTISGDKITIETDDTLFKLKYNENTSCWKLDKDFIKQGKLYDYDIYNNYTYCSDIFYIGTNSCAFRDLGVNSDRI